MHVKTQLFIYIGFICATILIGIAVFNVGFTTHRADMTHVDAVHTVLQRIHAKEVALLHFLSGDMEAYGAYMAIHNKSGAESLDHDATDHTMPDASDEHAALEDRERALHTELVDTKKFFESYTQAHTMLNDSLARASAIAQEVRKTDAGASHAALLMDIDSLLEDQQVLVQDRHGSMLSRQSDVVDTFFKKNDQTVALLKDLVVREVNRVRAQYPSLTLSLGLYGTTLALAEADSFALEDGFVRMVADGDRVLFPSEKTANVRANYRQTVQNQIAQEHAVPVAFAISGELQKMTLLEYYIEGIEHAQRIRESVLAQLELEDWYFNEFHPAFLSLKNDIADEQAIVMRAMHSSTSTVFWMAGLVALCITLSASVFSYMVFRGIINPLVYASDIAGEIARGNMDVAIDTSKKNELGDLSRALDRMRTSLKAVMQEYERKNISAAEKMTQQYRDLPK